MSHEGAGKRWTPADAGRPPASRGGAGRTLIAAAAAAAASAIAFARYRAWHLRWGATDAEVTGAMPGDDLLPSAAFVATRAIDVSAPPEQVWPWLVQVGFGRAGFYSYDWLDNLGRPSAKEILPDHQDPEVGDIAAPMTSSPDDSTAFRVAAVSPPNDLVWAKPDSTWSWRLTPTAAGTRVVTRLKARYERGPFLPVTVVLMEVGDFPMMRRMLLGLAARAESRADIDGS